MENTLGKRLAALRREKGMKQDELSEILGVSPQAISKWENDQTCPDISLLPTIAKTFGISVDELLSGKKEEAPTVRIVPANERKDIKDMLLRIVVNSRDGEEVRVNIPLAIIEALLDGGLNISQVSGNDSLKNIDFAKIMNLVRQGAVGNLLEVEASDGDIVRIFVE